MPKGSDQFEALGMDGGGDNIKICLKIRREGVYWIHLSHDMIPQQQILESTVMDL